MINRRAIICSPTPQIGPSYFTKHESQFFRYFLGSHDQIVLELIAGGVLAVDEIGNGLEGDERHFQHLTHLRRWLINYVSFVIQGLRVIRELHWMVLLKVSFFVVW